ncbi:sugar phosphate isomerase/epimerase and 4-hydroxyphenylpyruvate domain-containing protein [Microbacterium sp. Leaf151]|uniref:sugar phosphate isomerase/epimerase and 4-hydroxyphenylpyruvate domain-containing protein n=1 Tax=Microbacterium sp. Leaf151 TaxID=1736276 RepID=UPI0006F29AB7|nr:sugar phosphate isomerase/epimerase and 4-hydroxyphenylpyruvate domain-containing protein [Microbacterium sp. Leaf151]KQR25306.1 4-hydroxyphenylpyruvate dioxygenase [Microbacterium sp. Leaf151]
MKTSMATVCISGTLADKLHACAEAGFDGVEIFEPDLLAAPESPEEIAALAGRLGLSLDLYQPMRDVEGVDDEAFAAVLRRADAKFRLMRRLGIDLVLCCSNVATATIDDDTVSADQLRRLGDLAAGYGIRIAFEALAWGRFIDDYRRAWRIVELADHPAVGVCLDSFHILSRGHDPADIGGIPGEKIFFVQLADAPRLSMDVLSWSRHHRLFPGEGDFDLTDFTARIVDAGYTGPWSLEVFNDTFRQTDARRTARHARRSLRWLEDTVSRAMPDAPAELEMLPDSAAPSAVDFVEVKAEDTSGVEELLGQLGFTSRGRHRTKPVALWTAGKARVVLNEQHARGWDPRLAAIGLEVDDVEAVDLRMRELGVPRAYRRTYAAEERLDGAIAPDGTEVYWAQAADEGDPAWVREFEHGETELATEITGVDHVSLSQPWDAVEEATLFYTAGFALRVDSSTDVPGPQGLVASRVLVAPGGGVRLPLNVAPPILAAERAGVALPQHVAFVCADVRAVARAARERGFAPLEMPANYYDDIAARFALSEADVDELRDLHLGYDQDAAGEYLHFYTRTIGEVFFEFVERVDAYAGFGAGTAPVRLTAQGRR